jgi:hypothetical protein
MRALNATAIVRPDHTLTLQVPPDIEAGSHAVVVVFEDPGELHQQRTALRFTPHPVGPVDAACTYRREEMYGDEGR